MPRAWLERNWENTRGGSCLSPKGRSSGATASILSGGTARGIRLSLSTAAAAQAGAPQRSFGLIAHGFALAALTIGPQTDYSRALVGPAKGAISGESKRD